VGGEHDRRAARSVVGRGRQDARDGRQHEVVDDPQESPGGSSPQEPRLRPRQPAANDLLHVTGRSTDGEMDDGCSDSTRPLVGLNAHGPVHELVGQLAGRTPIGQQQHGVLRLGHEVNSLVGLGNIERRTSSGL
jgi:hypothetical protein